MEGASLLVPLFPHRHRGTGVMLRPRHAEGPRLKRVTRTTLAERGGRASSSNARCTPPALLGAGRLHPSSRPIRVCFCLSCVWGPRAGGGGGAAEAAAAARKPKHHSAGGRRRGAVRHPRLSVVCRSRNKVKTSHIRGKNFSRADPQVLQDAAASLRGKWEGEHCEGLYPGRVSHTLPPPVSLRASSRVPLLSGVFALAPSYLVRCSVRCRVHKPEIFGKMLISAKYAFSRDISREEGTSPKTTRLIFHNSLNKRISLNKR